MRKKEMRMRMGMGWLGRVGCIIYMISYLFKLSAYLYREIEVMMLFEIDVLIIYYSFNGFIINIKWNGIRSFIQV